ncbi:MAG: serine/threonine-protein kinase [Fuerstiella sp.]
MANDGQNLAKELFLAVLNVAAEDRAAWLAEQCGSDERLLNEVQSLLDHDRREGDPLERRIDSVLSDLPSTATFDHAGEAGDLSAEMAMVDSEQFLSRLSQVGVLSQKEIKALNQSVSTSDGATDSRQLASQLVQDGRLTEYQATALLKGQPELLIDKYLILDLLDGGGMGMVFKAIHRPMNRHVAIKMIAQHLLASPEQVKRFQREVRVAATLEHPNVVRSYDADQSKGVHFLVMEHVRGENLTRVVRREGPLSVERAVDCIRQAAIGLRYAQKHGVIHRDVKPGNLMLTDEGLVKILDLGLANIDESFRLAQQSSITGDSDSDTECSLVGSELTSAGAVLGTVSFMAPEQLLNAHKADTRADIYSLGCTLYYLLVGEAPYRGETIFQVFMQHREAEIPTLRDKRPDVPENVEAVCRKLLAKSPVDRYQSMGELLAAIEDCDIAAPEKAKNYSTPTAGVGTSAGSVVDVTTVNMEGRTRSFRRVTFAAVAVCALMSVLGGGYWWWRNIANQGDSQTPVAETMLADDDAAEAGLQQPSAADLLATGEWEWRIVERLPEQISAGGIHGADMTADGLTIVFASITRKGGYGGHDLWMATRSSLDRPWSEPVNLGDAINTGRHEVTPALSADGLRLTFSRGATVGAKGITATSTRRSSDGPWSAPLESEVRSFSFAPDVSTDGQSMVVTRLTGQGNIDVGITRRSSANALWPQPALVGPPVNTDAREESATLSDDGRLLIFARRDTDDWSTGDLWMSTRTSWDSPWDEPVRLDALNSEELDRNPRLLPDGRTLLFDRDNDFYLARLVRKDAPVAPIKGLEEEPTPSTPSDER